MKSKSAYIINKITKITLMIINKKIDNDDDDNDDNNDNDCGVVLWDCD
jgi:hypothetical protein